MYCTLGYTATVFVTGGVAFWGPAFAEYQIRMEDPTADTDDVGFYFGLITITGGVLGSAVGTLASKFMRSSRAIGQTSDAIACAIGALFTGPLLYMTMFVARFSTFGMWAMVFWTLTFLSINLVLNQEITLYGKNLKKVSYFWINSVLFSDDPNPSSHWSWSSDSHEPSFRRCH